MFHSLLDLSILTVKSFYCMPLIFALVGLYSEFETQFYSIDVSRLIGLLGTVLLG